MLNNCTVTGNSAPAVVGGVLNNCIVYYNSEENYQDDWLSGSNVELNYTCTFLMPTNGVGNITNAPLFVDTNNWADLRLLPHSPGIDAGDNAAVVGAIDLDGNPRIRNGIVDMGAYEFQGPADTHYVNINNPTPVAPYASWATVATSIQDAVDAADPGDTVLVTNGVYRTGGRPVGTSSLTNRVAVDKPLNLVSVNGPELTIIEGYQVPTNILGDGAIRCVHLAEGASLSGFTLTNGSTRVNYPASLSEQSGGGVWCKSTNVLVFDCLIVGNSAGSGGGAYNATLNSCTLTNNSAHSSGGGAEHSMLDNCILTSNSAGSGGGADESVLNNCVVANNWAHIGGGVSRSTANRCVFRENSANYDGSCLRCGLGGGAIFSTLSNCTLVGNFADYGGGGVHRCRLNNCTLTGNSAYTRLEGIGGKGGGALDSTLTNCIVYYNTSPDQPNYDTNTILSYTCTFPMPTNGVGNITNAPLFVDTNNWADLRLRPGSPCIDAGTNLLDLITTDFTGLPRPPDGDYDGVAQFDMGAYEFNPYASQPKPLQLGGYSTSGYATDVAVSGNLAFVADGEAGLQVIDISNPLSPVRVGGYDSAGSAQGVAVSAGYAYLADGDAGLQIINISNPANPQWVGGFDTSGYATDVAVSGNLAYVADGAGGLQIVDVSNRANPQWAGGYETVGEANGVVVSGNRAFVVYAQLASEGGLEVIDIGNPAAPASVGVIDGLGAAHGVALSANHAYVASSLGLHVIDVSNPGAPVQVGSYDAAGGFSDVAVADIYAYVVDRAPGLHVVDISYPADPYRVAANATFGGSSIAAAGDKVYVAVGEEGLIVLNNYVDLRIGPAIVADDGRLRLRLSGASGQCVRVQRSTNLKDWEDWKTVTLDGTSCELSGDTSIASQCFYPAIEDNSGEEAIKPRMNANGRE